MINFKLYAYQTVFKLAAPENSDHDPRTWTQQELNATITKLQGISNAKTSLSVLQDLSTNFTAIANQDGTAGTISMQDIKAKYAGAYSNSDQRHYAQYTTEDIFQDKDLSLQDLKNLRGQGSPSNTTSHPLLTTLNSKYTKILNTLIKNFKALDKNKNGHVNLSEVNDNLQLIAGVTSSSEVKKELLLMMMMVMSMNNQVPMAVPDQPLLPQPTSTSLFSLDLLSLLS